MNFAFDPWNLAPGATGRLSRGASSATDMWLDATKWWTEPMQQASQESWGETNGRLLAQLVAGVARVFTDRVLELDVDGRRLRAELRSVQLDRRSAGYEARLELGRVAWADRAIESLSIVARSVSLAAPPRARITTSDIEINGRATLEQVVAFLDTRVVDWTLATGAGNTVAVSRPDGTRTFFVDVVVLDDELRWQLRAIRWRRARVAVPRWLRVTRARRLPAIPGGASILEANCRGNVMDFRATIPSLSRQVDLGQVREAISRRRPFVVR
jgi:hypothetical protein